MYDLGTQHHSRMDYTGSRFWGGRNWSNRRKPSKSDWDRLKLNPHTTFVIEVESVIDVQGVQHRKSSQIVTLPDINPVQRGLTSVKRKEPGFPLVLAAHGVRFGQFRWGRLITNSVYTWVSEWVSEWHICISKSPQETCFYASRIHEIKNDNI